ncbi:DUF6502 family protein [Marinicella sediminis]|uniref:DUF6502 family protein n=1 Tax=Marinicella sediminis TaxID=1792834 RepID=A0ABV7JDH3_9GAMM|nr:DUF6502 family protein [Marinicella sediminis]
MKNTLNNAIRRMLIQVFRPLVRIMLRLNVPFHEAADVLRWTYVDVADRHFGINGKPPTKSRMSVITGLSRTQVDIQIKKDLFDEDEQPNKWHRAVRVLTGWVEDEAFLDPQGHASIIPLESSDETDFKTLVDRYSGGATYRSILDDLLLSGSVKVKNGQVQLIKPYYLTENDDDDIQKIDFLGVSTQYLLETIDHNIDPERPGPKFQRIVYHEGLPASLYNIAESFVRSRCQSLANEVDEYLAHLIQHADNSQQDDLIPYVGVGLYFYNGESVDQSSEVHTQLTGVNS